MASALGLILREKLTGEPVPKRAAAGVEMVRAFIEERAGADFDALALSLDNQKAFQGLALDLLRHLDLTVPEDIDQPSDDSDDGDEPEGARVALEPTPAEASLPPPAPARRPRKRWGAYS